MGKRRWRRVRLGALASAGEQKRVLGALDRAKGESEIESPEKRPSESPQVECREGTLAPSLAPGGNA